VTLRGTAPPPVPEHRWWSGLAATVCLAGLVVMVPWALWRLAGVPVTPGMLRAVEHATLGHRSVDAGVVAGWLVHTAVLLAWATWLWLVACVVRELRGVRSRRVGRLPGSRTMQAMVACLVGASLALLLAGRAPGDAGRRPVPVMTAGPLGPLHVVDDLPGVVGSPAPMPPSSAGGVPVLEATAEGARAGAPGARETPGVASVEREASAGHVVSPGETLWSVAASRLGSALRWRELAELNYGRLQADGGALGRDHWIQPGWRLHLPPGALPSRGPVPSDAILDEWISPVPTDPGRAEVRATAGGEAGREHGREAGGEAGGEHDQRTPDVVAGSHKGADEAGSLVGAGILGAGLTTVLERMRRAQQRHRATGEYIRLPCPDLTSLEQRVRAAKDGEAPTVIDAALRMAGRALGDPGAVASGVVGIRLGPREVEITVDAGEGGPPEPAFPELSGAMASGGTWRVARNVLVRETVPYLGRGGEAPCPGLVAIGAAAETVELINLQYVRSLALAGDPEACVDLLRALAVGLATSPWSDRIDLVLAGHGWHQTADHPVPIAGVLAALVGSGGGGNVPDPRLRVVLAGPSPTEDREALAALMELADGSPGAPVVVSVGEHPGACHVLRVAANGRAAWPELVASVLRPQAVGAAVYAGLDELVGTARDLRSVPPSAPPYDALTIPLPNRARRSGGSTGTTRGDPPAVRPGTVEVTGECRIDQHLAVPDGQVEVAVLGPVEIRGAEQPFARAWSEELVVYLAMHPHGVPTEMWATALWPDRRPAESSLHSTASVARRALGRAPDGGDHLPRSHGRLQLAASVTTDWSRFVALAESDDPDHWRSAIGLVRGRPFDGLRAVDWPVLEGISPAIESGVVDVALRLAGALLEAGDPAGASWAARRGLLASPYDERLYRVLLTAADRSGHPAGVEAVMEELVRLVADGVDPFDAVHPETLDLYRSLSRRQAFAWADR
jgi:DNA-binding SARP family transcriptional activator